MSDIQRNVFKEPEIALAKLADHVLQLSDFYIENQDAETPWDKEYVFLDI